VEIRVLSDGEYSWMHPEQEFFATRRHQSTYPALARIVVEKGAIIMVERERIAKKYLIW